MHTAKEYKVYRNISCHPDGGGAKFLQNVGSYKEPHGITSQKMPLFIITAVKTSNPTYSSLFFFHVQVIH
jgi:hypothetical protein